MLESLFSKRSFLKYELAEDLSRIRADRTQISQILVNLVTNAAEAVGDDAGIVTLSTGESYLSDAALADTLHTGQIIAILIDRRSEDSRGARNEKRIQSQQRSRQTGNTA